MKKNNKEIESRLRQLRPTPLGDGERTALWSRIRERIRGIAPVTSPFAGQFNLWRLRPAVAAVLVVLILGGSAATVMAADSAKPGDFLFPVDLAVEKFRLALASDDKKDVLRVRFAEERLDEARSIVKLSLKTELTVSATSSDDTATSTDDTATSTPPADETFERAVERANEALTSTLERLEQTRDRLEERGNTTAVEILDIIIEELRQLAEDQLSRLEQIRSRIEQRNGKFRFEFQGFSDELRERFRLEVRQDVDDEDEEEEDDEDEDNLEDFEKRIEERRQRTEERLNELRERLEERRENMEERREKIEERLEERRGEIEERLNKVLNRIEDRFGQGEKVTVCHIPPGNIAARHTISVGAAAVQAHLAHGDILGECEDMDDGEDENDTIAPEIKDVEVNAASTTALIKWETDEPADSTVWYGTSTPLVTGENTTKVSLTALVEDHEIQLSGLTASTTYYFIVGSSDENGNAATSSESSFTTSN